MTQEKKNFYENLSYDYSDGLILEEDKNSKKNKITSNLKDTDILKENYINYHYLCLKCHFFPHIQISNKNEIYYTCGCTKREKKLISIKEFINNRIGYITQIDNKVLKGLPKNKGLRCNQHNHKFSYYCKKCHINICKDCCIFHLNEKHDSHDLINFDFNIPDIRRKSNKLIEFFDNKKKENPHTIEIKRNHDNNANLSELLQNSSNIQEENNFTVYDEIERTLRIFTKKFNILMMKLN